MAITIANGLTDGLFNIRMTIQDSIGEQIRKVFKLYDDGTPGEDLEAAMQAFEALTDGGIVSASASLDAGLTGANATPTAGDYDKTAWILMLGFERPHPLNSAKTAVTSFAIPAPDDAVIDADGRPVMTRGIGFTASAAPGEALGSLVDYLEDNLVMIPIDGVAYRGNWTYAPGRTALVSRAAIFDGSPLS